MLKILKVLSRNKIFYAFLLLILLMFPSTLYLNSDKDNTVIITTIGIDKGDNGYTLSALAVIPKGSNDVSANLEVFEGNGESISKAFNDISTNIGKIIGLAHCDCIILSEDLMDENMSNTLDYFIRTSNLSTNATLIATDSKAKDLLDATKNSNNLLDLSLKNIVTFDEKNTLLEGVNVEKFYKNYFTKGSTFCLPELSTKSPDEQSKVSSGSGSGSEDNEPNDGSGGGGSGQEGDQKKISNNGEIIVTKLGKKLRKLEKEELFIYNLLSPSSKYLELIAEDINDRYVTNSTEIYNQKSKLLWASYDFVDDIPTIKYTINLSLVIEEIIGSNYTYASIDSEQNFISSAVENKFNDTINSNLEKTLELMKADKIDILNLYAKFNAFEHKKWNKYLETLENEEDYLSGINITIDIKYNFVI